MLAGKTTAFVVIGLACSALGSCAWFGFDIDVDGYRAAAMGASPWSPDGKTLVLSSLAVPRGDERPAGLLRFQLDEAVPQVLVAGDHFWASWSPDGRSIASVCGSESAGPRALVVSSVDGVERFLLALTCFSPVWSPDGEWIAVSLVEQERVVLVRADGATWKDVGPGALPAWSPDGAHIACMVFDHDEPWIEIMDREGGERTRLTHGRAPSWSPDGRWLAFVDDEDGETGVFRIGGDGSERKRLSSGSSPYWSSSPCWSPSGDRILFSRQPLRASDLLTIHPDGSERRVLAQGGLRGRWSPDGAQVAFLREGSLFVVNADGSGERSLGEVRVPESQPTNAP